jgi:dienelactone hydrolase
MSKSKKYIFLIGLLATLIIGYFIANKILFDGIKPSPINTHGFQAQYYVKANTKNQAAVLLIGGGQWGDYWAQQFAKNNMVGLSIPYLGKEGLPKLVEEIELEYFEKAINWLIKQPEVNPNKIIVMGTSRNAELALLIAATFPEAISGAVAYAPTAVSWSNTVMPYSDNQIKASWKYKGHAIAYVPMNKIKGNPTHKIRLLDYWNSGLAKTEFVAEAAIKVEKINGPILLFSGKDDKVWPASTMANMIEKRLEAQAFKHEVQNIKYDNAGHLISNNPEDKKTARTAKITIDGKAYEYEFGGNDEGDFNAKQDAKIKLMAFLKKI